ncbi:hypothetical protein [Altibacter sp.]|uniref:hypothetical protein n=1 Tax=Altibacter sp. TaxID=2024823 RepID=UPI000C952DDF|nr:hypothetical protein [Altibacter sp.]MAP53566.1 hypothetical protein [Altibacter sp.]|tara:strand:+ start:96 stop:476 length:381 start_codon:yes stop_codon:yes gene_type:complete
MKTQDQILHDEMRKLIKRSCAIPPNLSNDFYTFQKTLLKFFFNAADVTIDYDSETISLWTSSSTQPITEKLYDMNDAVAIKISYTNLEETLKGCLENGQRQSRFYQTLLFHYNHVSDTIPNPAISA